MGSSQGKTIPLTSQTSIYVLELKEGKYYVGQSSSVVEKVYQHFNGEGCAWTQQYKPIKLLELRDVHTSFDENNITKEYMKRYGIEHVRGGSYHRIILEDNVISLLNQEIWPSEDKESINDDILS
jgi:predicted GIY-YIG superfamily endonuclease